MQFIRKLNDFWFSTLMKQLTCLPLSPTKTAQLIHQPFGISKTEVEPASFWLECEVCSFIKERKISFLLGNGEKGDTKPQEEVWEEGRVRNGRHSNPCEAPIVCIRGWVNRMEWQFPALVSIALWHLLNLSVKELPKSWITFCSLWGGTQKVDIIQSLPSLKGSCEFRLRQNSLPILLQVSK